ncbi:MAG TPA: ROK family protein [Nitriliruptoraceae bacterium]|nr:ROK family protein [Nitriliruptoraceae bacterium]
MARIAGVDIGGTNITAALVEDDHSVGDRLKVATPTDGPKEVIQAVADLLEQFDTPADAVGIGMPGPINDGVVSTPPNLRNWPDEYDFGKKAAKALGVPVAVGNDVNVAILGEWEAGAGRGSRHVLGVWMGTGVGGGLILDGRPYTGPTGAAGEFGHMIVRAGGAQCGCGRRGCIEAYAGRANMERFVERAVASGGFESSIYDIRDDKGKDRLTSSVWAKALKEEDAVTVRVFDDAIEAVAIGIASVLNLLDVDRVVIGGGVAEKLGQDLADRIKRAAAPHTFVAFEGRDFVVAELEDDSGIVGAAALGRAALILG